MQQCLFVILFFFSVLSSNYASAGCANQNALINLPTYLRTTGFHSNAKNDAFINLKEKTSVAVTRTVNASAISFTISDLTALMASGKTQLIHSGGSFTMNIGTADAVNPQTWIMPTDATLFSNLIRKDFIDPSTITPATAFISGATYAYKELVNKSGIDYSDYRQYSLSADSEVDELGATRVRKSDNQVFSGTDPAGSNKLLKAPFNLGDNVTSYEETFAVDGIGNDYLYVDVINVDAFGTLQLPNGVSYSCLRFKSTETIHTFDAATHTETGATSTIYRVFWLTKEGYIYNGETSAPDASGTVNLSSLNFNEFVPTSTLSVLPVELIKFSGKEENNSALLEWTTASEKNNQGFDIEKSNDGINFSKMGFVAGAGTVSTTQNYSFKDNALTGLTYYRLKQIDFSSETTTSNIIVVEPKISGAQSLKIFPNPATGGKLSVEISPRVTDVAVYNISGELVLNQSINANGILSLDISSLPIGTYIVKAKNNGDIIEVSKFVKN